MKTVRKFVQHPLHGSSWSSMYYNWSSYSFFSGSSFQNSQHDDDKKAKQNISIKSILPTNKDAIDATTRSIGQVIFLNSTKSGTAILASLAIGDPTLAVYAGLGAYTATVTAQAIGLNQQSCRDGLFGYNGALIGCATSVFGPSFVPFGVAYTMMGASATSVLCASLNRALSQPQWTWSFNVVALTSILRTKPLETVTELTASDAAATSLSVSVGIMDFVASPLVGVSQIFVVGSAVTGLGIIGSISMYSPKLAVHALGGSTLGCLVGLLFGADSSDVIIGLWGYNSALASMAVGTFFVHSREAIALSAGSAAASAALFGELQPVFGGLGAPCLTLPFCAVSSACYLLEGQIQGLKLAKEPHSPEKNA
jgi:urea transporter